MLYKVPPSWTNSDFDAAIRHSLQIEALERVTARLTELRQSKTAVHLYEFQAKLLGDVYWVQEYKSRSKRYVERIRRGKAVSEIPPSGSWELEHRIASRVERQVRSVGDCLAWKVLGCRRDVFWVLSQNQNPGSIYEKKGLEAEVERVEFHWRHGRFALLNDLTLSIRISDLTVFTNKGPYLDEVKTDPLRQRSDQRRRIRQALQALNREGPLNIAGKPHDLFQARTQIKTRMDCLAAALKQSQESGFGSSIIQPGWLITTISFMPRTPPPRGELDIGELTRKARVAAAMASGGHELLTIWSWRAWDYPNPLVGRVPFGAYPLDPVMCAELTCGYSAYQNSLNESLVDRELEAAGLSTRWARPVENSGPGPGETLFEVYRQTGLGRHVLRVAANGFMPMVHELVEPHRYAQAVRELFDWSAARSTRGVPMTMAFSNEKAVWFKKPKTSRS